MVETTLRGHARYLGAREVRPRNHSNRGRSTNTPTHLQTLRDVAFWPHFFSGLSEQESTRQEALQAVISDNNKAKAVEKFAVVVFKVSLILITIMNTVHNILNTNFSNLPLEDKLKIKELGRPLPNLKLTQISERKAENRSFTRHFSRDIYTRNNWICGCDVSNLLYCFPCLLLYNAGSGMDRNWARTGIKDIHHLPAKIKNMNRLVVILIHAQGSHCLAKSIF
uniref:Uncharacterized protein LOC114336680 n=1 Tax=Diabrotica virgifera virgifera TaxID=50390 RepID=A0A6P7GFP9_DIAVI